ncbi:MAG TPA: hypothetical protein VF467_09780 [Afipia sp.]
MLLVRLLLVAGVVMIVAAVSSPTARAATDVWGCNYEKCVAYCTKTSGKFCTTHCERRLKDKRRDNICK